MLFAKRRIFGHKMRHWPLGYMKNFIPYDGMGDPKTEGDVDINTSRTTGFQWSSDNNR